MNVASMALDFRLGGCRSLKEKRHRLRGLKEKYGRAPNVAVCESRYQDSHHLSQWTFIACASDPKVVERTLAEVERNILVTVDAEVVNIERFWLD